MLPLSVSTLASVPSSASDAPLGQPSDGAGTADFGALLTAQVATPGQTGTAPAPLAPLMSAVAALPTDPASLPESGNILPDALPDSAPEPAPVSAPMAAPVATLAPVLDLASAAALQLADAPQSEAQAAPAPAKPMPAVAATLARAISRDKADRAPETSPAADPASAEETSAAPIASADPTPAAAALAIPVIAVPAAQTNAATPDPVEPATARAAPQMPLPLQANLARGAAPAKPAASPEPQQQAQPLPVLALDRAAPPAAAVFAAALPSEAPAPTLTARIRLNDAATATAGDLLRDSAPAAGEAMAIPLASPAAAIAAPVTAPTAPAANRPHDFTALVDSLVAAREAAQPQAVSIALSHAEFGPVHLRFNHDDAGLSVSMASADPGFARAASLAVPTLQASMASSDSASQQQPNPGQNQAQNAARQNGASTASGGFSQGQDRPAPERDDHRTPRANPSAAARDPGTARAGIFA